MDSKRFLLAIGLTLLILWLYQSWLEYRYPDYYRAEQTVSEGQKGSAKGPASQSGTGTPGAGKAPATKGMQKGTGDEEVPQVSRESREEKATGRDVPGAGRGAAADVGLTVETDLLRVGFSGQSGDPLEATLLRYQQKGPGEGESVRVLEPNSDRVVVAQAGWVAERGQAPSHLARYQGEATGTRNLKPGEDTIGVTFTHEQGELEFRKTYRLRRGSYRMDVEYTVVNRGDQAWQGHLYGQFKKRGKEEGSFFLYHYDGPVVFAKGEMRTFTRGGLAERTNGQFQVQDAEGWAGVMNRYFLAAWIPASSSGNAVFARASGPDVLSGFTTPFPRVAPGEERTVTQTLFLGPKEQSLLEEVGRNLRRSVDYGILSFLAIPLFEVLQFFHRLVGNYGFAIILVTLVIKAVFFPLFSISYRAMAKMRKVQPELQRIRENYSDDRQKMNEEMMRLYKEERVNPLGGCLPILVQIPVFISLYWVLLESVELRHEPFILWITDLTSKDPFYVLPVLMGGSMVVQQLLNPSPLDPVQKKVMLALPVVFTVFFTQFPAGLVLYWVSNNVISIAQQWWITRKVG